MIIFGHIGSLLSSLTLDILAISARTSESWKGAVVLPHATLPRQNMGQVR